MKILALETSGPVGSIAALDDDRVLVERDLGKGLEHGRLLVSVVDVVIREAGWNPRGDVELIAIGLGPGSFTGLRVGLTFAKTMAALSGIPLVGICSLDIMARNAPDDEADILTILDAKRGDVYAAAYERRDGGLKRMMDPCIALPEKLREQFKNETHILGDGLLQHAATFNAPQFHVTPPENWQLHASVAGKLGLAAWSGGHQDDPFSVQPIYLRLAEAEERRLARERGQK